MTEIEILKKNVSDLQEQLQKSYTRIKELNKKVNNLTKLLNILRGKVPMTVVEKTKKRDPNWKWLRALGHKIVLAKKGKGSYNRKSKHRKEK
jgi:predicted RNase H-like nuclease (RuvC/YqgF family)|tara:strand:- start:1110 stop:1385 length:276 start_codon:yes stop_codon:yes gene_type:complete